MSDQPTTFEFVADGVADPVVTAAITVGDDIITLMAEVFEDEIGGRKRLRLQNLHLHTEDEGRRRSTSFWKSIAARVMEELGYDEIIVEGAVRTTGARPGHRPGVIRYTRARRDPSSTS